MSLHNRFWRLARGLGRRVSDDVRTRRWRSRGEEPVDERSARLDAEAEAAARAEVNAIEPRIPGSFGPGGASLPPKETVEELGVLEERAAGRSSTDSYAAFPEAGIGAAVDPALAPHYATLGLPPGAPFDRVESAYYGLKGECRPANPDDAVEQARCRRRDAALDEAYLTLRKALVAERKL